METTVPRRRRARVLSLGAAIALIALLVPATAGIALGHTAAASCDQITNDRDPSYGAATVHSFDTTATYALPADTDAATPGVVVVPPGDYWVEWADGYTQGLPDSPDGQTSHLVVGQCTPRISTVANPTTGAVGVPGVVGDTATLSAPVTFVTGTSVAFTLYSDSECSASTGVTGTGALNESGVATFSQSWTPSAAGTYYWRASFPGDTYNSAVAGCGGETETVVVSQPPPPPTPYCIDISKVNGSEQALSSAVFTIKQDGTPVDVTGNPVTTNSDGNASLCGLAAGTYVVVETTPPSGYTGAADQTVTLSQTSEVTTLTFVDTLIPPPPPGCTVNCNPPVILTPGLSVTKFVSLSQSGPFNQHSITTAVGTTVWYQVAMTNNGQEALSGVTFGDSLGLPSSCSSVPTTLSVGASFSCTYSRPATLGTTDNTATGTSSQIGPRSDTATVIGTAVPVAPQTPTGGVAGATGRPHITPPPTSALGSVPAQPAGDTWWIVLLGLAALSASLLVFIPKTSSERRHR
jgi:uncharacterized repeat protein (TIGR01451 family)